jgi:uncharacterized protein YdcH (DUF465 family)
MEPLWIALANLGGGFTLAGVILLLHREALKAFREEMATERQRNDANLGKLFDKFDTLRKEIDEAKCRAPIQHPAAVSRSS